MSWGSLMGQAAGTVTAAFGQPAMADSMPCRVILDVIPRALGVFDSMAENHPVMIFLRSEISDLDVGAEVDIQDGDETYLIEAPAEERSDVHHIAYWVSKIPG